MKTRSPAWTLALMLAPLGAFGFASHLAAQPDQTPQEQTVQDEARSEQRAAQREQGEIQRELEQARADLQAAARQVARLSAELAAPFVGEVKQRFRFAGQRAMLGLSPEDVDRGVRVAGVSPNGPAAAAGIQAGDVIVAINGRSLSGGGERSPTQLLLAQMKDVAPGATVALKIERAGRDMDVNVVAREAHNVFSWPGEWPDFDFGGAPRPPGAPDGLGGPLAFLRGPFGAPDAWRSMELVALTPELGQYFGTDRGILVVQAPDDDALGLRDGDVILDIGGREPTTPEHAMRILASFVPGETLRMTIMRRQQRETVEIVLPQRGADAEVGVEVD